MEPILERIRKGEAVIADGGLGSMLISRGASLSDSVELLNLRSPHLLMDIAACYLKAGAEIIQTNTFGSSPLKLKSYALEDQYESITRSAVRNLREIVAGKAYISGSVGPSGKMLEPFGDVSLSELTDSFEKQISVLIEEGVDLICIETMTDLNEAVAAVSVSKKISPSTPVIATMTYNETPNGFYTMMGHDIKTSVNRILDAGADIVGSNCGHGPQIMARIARQFKENTRAPIIIQSNAGLPERRDAEVFYKETPENFRLHALELLEIGVSIIGGCCGTTPEHTRSICQAFDEYRKLRKHS